MDILGLPYVFLCYCCCVVCSVGRAEYSGGDVVGVGYLPDRKQVFFTKAGAIISVVPLDGKGRVPDGPDKLCCVVLAQPGAAGLIVAGNFGAAEFDFKVCYLCVVGEPFSSPLCDPMAAHRRIANPATESKLPICPYSRTCCTFPATCWPRSSLLDVGLYVVLPVILMSMSIDCAAPWQQLLK